MIYLTTGGNGAGKTLLTLKDVRDQQLKENRPVYFHGFKAKQVLLDWGWQEFDPKKWQDLPDGSICVMDECQNEFPAKIQGELPDYVNAVAQHRRRRGFDFWMITPHPSLINVNIRRLIESPSWHRHLKRTAGAAMVSELKFNFAEIKCEQPGSGARGVVTMRAYPKEVYDWYDSASLHTGKVRIPKQVWMLAACALLVPTLGYFAFTKVYSNVTKQAKPAQAAASGAGSAVAAPVAAPGRILTAMEYIDQRKPRLPDFAHTAPAYDDVTKPTEAPYPAACVQMGKTCKCYTQQATLLQVSGAVCLQIVAQGFFMDWKTAKGEFSRDRDQQRSQPQQGQQVAQADPMRSVPVPMPSARPDQPQNTYLQGLAARNAQVRSSLTQ
ncbi:MAG: zonular occludens toxin [Comamonadaceae bacterium]|nr:zonular occludens toxin [Comamonadaceae bacterium]